VAAQGRQHLAFLQQDTRGSRLGHLVTMMYTVIDS